MLTYEQKPGSKVIGVRLGKLRVGEIRAVVGGYAYFPGGLKKWRGDTMATVEAVKASLEEA